MNDSLLKYVGRNGDYLIYILAQMVPALFIQQQIKEQNILVKTDLWGQ